MPPKTIAQAYIGDPPFGPLLSTGLRRALLGWNHFNDNPAALMHGRIWCWVSDPRGTNPKFQVYDTPGNRSPIPEVVVDCGVANFTMVRMFHPWWAIRSQGDWEWRAPKDMNSRDKKHCRRRYWDLVRQRQRDEQVDVVGDEIVRVGAPARVVVVIDEDDEDDNDHGDDRVLDRDPHAVRGRGRRRDHDAVVGEHQPQHGGRDAGGALLDPDDEAGGGGGNRNAVKGDGTTEQDPIEIDD